ncbi:hypothetical protein [Azohydromonas australica]|uniref:hypothetical protein n=1 Tax=Azohydromonas australica TaxID=364039 RepID=UPI0012EBF761|nr:hypothetical protein [Azohydromonas australica]
MDNPKWLRHDGGISRIYAKPQIMTLAVNPGIAKAPDNNLRTKDKIQDKFRPLPCVNKLLAKLGCRSIDAAQQSLLHPSELKNGDCGE